MKRISRLVVIVFLFSSISLVLAHPLGNFSVNRYSRLEAGANRLRIYYVLDLAEIPSFGEIKRMDSDDNDAISDDEKSRYLETKLEALQSNLYLLIDNKPQDLEIIASSIEFVLGQGGLKTIRLSCTFSAPLSVQTSSVLQVAYRDENNLTRIGWREIVARAEDGLILENSTVPATDISNELRNYPEDLLMSPLEVWNASFTIKRSTSSSAPSTAPAAGDQPFGKSDDAFAALISGKELSFSFVLFALLAAMFWGAVHALSPGHGKTVVAAYLVGSRGTAKHAIFLGATVTATHTIGVFALGLITLFASQFILPETLYPWLSLASGLIVVGIGIYMLAQRLGIFSEHAHEHDHSTGELEHDHVHTHAAKPHSHLPPGADGAPVTWKSLFALGVSGGLLPCPSALVVLLSAISLHRIGFGLLLIVAFSVGLASVLTGIGLLLVYARRFFERMRTDSPIMRLLPAVSAGVILLAGLIITAQAFAQLGFPIPSLAEIATALSQPTTISVLSLGFVLGLKHALDADHLVAITTILSEKRGLFSSAIIGAVWGLGHTAALLAVGIVVLLLQAQIPERVALVMEFAVAIMLVLLGANLLRKIFLSKELHMHAHQHGGHFHAHPHVHERAEADEPHTHHGLQVSGKPFLIGLVHGMAGSAALMLLVLATIPSPIIGLLYIAIFGIGSVGGMLLMSAAISLPFAFTANKFLRLNFAVRALAGVFSIAFGIFMMYEIGFVDGLFL
jgi:ABC-type nickel/cobalt efflux system permease component RcnA